ncbi:hypothetical protein LCGC14_2804420, partial [marine sediment metagenome]
MKCPACWTEKAYRRQVKGRKGTILRCLLIVPMRCRHCYHEFCVPWILTIGKKTTPPASISSAQKPCRRPDIEGDEGKEVVIPIKAKRTDHTPE